MYVYVERVLFHTFMYRFWLLFKCFGVVLPFEFIVAFCVGGQAWISCSIVVFTWLRFCLSSCTIMGQLTGLVSRCLDLSTRPPQPLSSCMFHLKRYLIHPLHELCHMRIVIIFLQLLS